MSQQPFSPSALRGAVDLSALSGAGRPGATGRSAPAAGQQAASPGGGAGSGLVLEATDATFNQVVSGTVSVPAVLVLWAEQVPESRDHVALLGRLAQEYQGRFQVVAVELGANPGVMQAVTPVLQQAFGQITSLPVVLGLLAGQPFPFYLGPQPEPQVRQVLDKFLEAAVANGVTGRADLGGADADGAAEPQLPESHRAALEALERGDHEAAAWPASSCCSAPAASTSRRCAPPRPTTRATRRRRSTPRTSTSSGATSRTRSPGSSTPSG